MPRFPNLSRETHEPTTEAGRQVATDLSQRRDRKAARTAVDEQLAGMGTTAAEAALVRDIAEGVTIQGHALQAADVDYLINSLRDGTLPSALRAQFKVTAPRARSRGTPDTMPLDKEYQPSEGSAVHFRPKHGKPPTAEETLEATLEEAGVAADDPLREEARRAWTRLQALGGGISPGLVVRLLKGGHKADAVVRQLTGGT